MSARATTTAAPEHRAGAATRRTLLCLLASALAALPLKGLLSDFGWLVDVWLSMAIVIVPATLLRLRRPPGALDIWPGIFLLIPWLTVRFVPQHALAGVFPTHRTLRDVAALMDSLHATTRDEIAPVHSTTAVRLVLCALLGLLAALIDLIAVVSKRGALAGVPMLVVYTVSGAVPRHPVSWAWFVLAAAGYLILLAVDSGDELDRWGRRVARRGGTDRIAGSISAQRVGIIAIVVAIAVPLLVPAQSRNLISDAFHHSGGHGSGNGIGVGSSISPYADLKGQLKRNTPADVMTVQVTGTRGAKPPFYVRSNVLDNFTGSGWRVSDHGNTERIGSTDFSSDPPSIETTTNRYRVSITVSGLGGSAPVFAQPTTVTGLDSATTWSAQDQLLLGADVHRGQKITENIAEPAPARAELEQSVIGIPGGMERWLALPTLPRKVRNLVGSLIRGKSGAYDRARAISDYFADPANGFRYSLKTKAGDSGSDLVDFLDHKVGYCQQYAGAMGVMLREAGIPARVVLGYMHPALDSQGKFSVTTFDAHAWVEAYFSGIGWVPFDPTPVEGLDGGRKSDLGYAPHVYTSGNNDVLRGRATNIRSSSNAPTSSPATSPNSTATAYPGRGTGTTTPLWLGSIVALLLAAALAPAAARTARRQRRYSAARNGDPDPLWAELSDTAVDLGYVWSAARTPRQVAAWLGRDAAQPGALDPLATAVEHRRYSADGNQLDTSALARDVTRVTAELRSRRSGAIRLRARLWPASLGLGGRLRGVARRHR